MNLETLAPLVNAASALSLVADLQSAERTPDGHHLVAPPTYANAASNGTGYLLVGLGPDGHADSVRLDSPQSMAHRLTQVLAAHGMTSNIVLLKPAGEPLLTKEGIPARSSMLSHRASDAILQDSQVNGLPFRQSDIGRAILLANPAAAGPWWQYFPEVLLFGFWDSFAKIRSGVPHGAKVARSLLAEIYGYGLRVIPGGATKVDLLGINNSAGKLYLDQRHQVSLEALAVAEKAKLAAAEKAKRGKAEKKSEEAPVEAEAKGFKPSELGHGGIVQKDPATARRGDTPARPRGVAAREIALQGYLSLNYLQGFRFGDNEELNRVIRTAIAAAGLASLYTLLEKGVFLRSGAQLHARSATLRVERGLQASEAISGSAEDWFRIYAQAADRARELGLPRITEPVHAVVSTAVVKAIADSKAEGEREDDSDG